MCLWAMSILSTGCPMIIRETLLNCLGNYGTPCIWYGLFIDVDNLFIDGLTQLKQVYVKETQRVVFTTDEKTEERTHKCLEVAYLFWILQYNMYICNLIVWAHIFFIQFLSFYICSYLKPFLLFVIFLLYIILITYIF